MTETELTPTQLIDHWKQNDPDMYELFIQDCYEYSNKVLDYNYTLEEFIKSDDFDEDFHNWLSQA